MSASNSTDKRQFRVRNNIKKRNRSSRAKISVFRSNKNIYAQLIDVSGKVLHSFSSTVLDEKELKGAKGLDIAKLVGTKFAEGCVKKGVAEVVFDKGSYQYGGRVKALAESCRAAGLKF